MDEHTQHRLRHHWFGWIAMLAFASVLSPIHIHVLIAQDAPKIAVAPADPGKPPTPPPVPTQAAAEVADLQPDPPAVELLAPIETPISEPDVPTALSEVSSDVEMDKLIPSDEPHTESVAIEPPLTDSIRTLSVEPGVRMLPADRPAWVGAAPDFSSNLHHLYVGSLPTTNESEADEALDEPLIAAVRNYIDQEVVNEPGASLTMPIDANFIRRNLIDDPSGFVCELSTSQGAMFQKWVAVHITHEQRSQFAQWHIEASQRSRLAPLGLGLISVLALVSLSHMILRRRNGQGLLPSVNLNSPEPAVAVRRSRVRTAFKTLGLLIVLLMIPAFFILGSVAFVSRTEVYMPDLHDEVRIETFNGQEIMVLERQSHQ